MEPDVLCWDERNWSALTYAIFRQKCILLLGPGASLESTGTGQPPAEGGEDFKPCTRILANELSRDIGEAITRWNINPNDLPQVSQYFLIHNSPNELALKVMAFYAKREKRTSPIHQNLAKLPFYLVITSTLDNMYLNALKELTPPKKPSVDFHHFKGPKLDHVEMGTVDCPLIYRLYGSLENPDSLIITENAFLDLLVRAASGIAPIPENILSELTDEDKCILFLGFGFRHWYLRVLLHVLKIGSKNNPSFALETIKPKSIEEIRRATLFIKQKGAKIQICDVKLADFAEQLANRYKSEYGGKDPQPTKTAPAEFTEQPSIFISYVRENEAYVRDLQAKLRQNNLDAQIDRDFLEPGDRWSGEIDQWISKFDYFILTMSRDLVRQPESYVYHELNVARERQSRYQPGLKFIIPVMIDNCDIPSYIRDLHVDSIDLRSSTGVSNIVKAIKRDFQLRKRESYAK